MKQHITLLLATLGILALAGCVQEDYEPIFVTPSDSESVEEVPADEQVDWEETEEADSSEDTPEETIPDEESEVEPNSSSEANTDLDSSSEAGVELDWVTYRNEEYGFSFEYPNGWSAPEEKLYESNEYQEGNRLLLIFRDEAGTTADLIVTLETEDYLFTGPADGRSILFSDLDLTLSDAELVENLKRPNTSDLSLERVTNDQDISGVRLVEKAQALDGTFSDNIHYMLQIDLEEYKNLRVYTDSSNESVIDTLFESLKS